MAVAGPSSDNLHPREGARFVFERIAGAEASTPFYRVAVYLPLAEVLRGEVTWDAEGQTVLLDLPDSHWTSEGVRKLARVLRREPIARLVRWREAPSSPDSVG